MINIVAFKEPPVGSIDDILRWIVFSSASRTTTRLGVVWSLPRFAAKILNLLPEPVRKELSQPPHKSKYNNFRLFYIPEKILACNLNGSEMNIYDLSQYFPESPEPTTIEQLQQKADELSQALSDLGIPKPKTLASPVAVFGDQLDKLSSAIPTIFDFLGSPDSFDSSGVSEAFEVALQCTPREWNSNYQVGYFPKLYSHDISSAYPSLASDLVDLRDCVLQKSDTMISAIHGFLVGDFTVYPNHPLAFCSPFLADCGDGTLVNFVGTVRNYPCLLKEVESLAYHQMGEFKLKYGWFVLPKDDLRYPFEDFVDHFYSLRDGSELKSYIPKRVLNGLIGKLLEVRKDSKGNVVEYGILFNPIYHAIITAQCRLSVFASLVDNKITKSELVSVDVDGFKSLRHVPYPEDSSLGQWRSRGCEPAAVFSPGGLATDHRNFKGTGLQFLLAQRDACPSTRLLGVSEDISLRDLWANQTRQFPKLPKTAHEFFSASYHSEPIEL